MKTNITMRSEEDRNLYGVVIKQETQTGFMSLTDLQEAYTHARVLNGWKDKGHIQDIIKQTENSERLYYLLKERGVINSGFSDFMEMVEKDSITKVLKSCGVYKTTGRGENKRVMCDPYIWVLVAMELNPQIYAKVIMWVTDKLILNRIEAGNFYKKLSSALERLGKPDYISIAIALNMAVFGEHFTGIRNTKSEKELENLYRLEDKIAFAIDNGFVKTQEEVISLIKRSN